MTTVGSFCSGYGGLDLAAEYFFDAELSWWCDNAETPKHLMATHWPEATAHHDLTKINPHDLEPVDIISAGFPCQPFSLAGYRRGNEDERAIFSWIVDSVGVVRPRYVFLENVAAITPWGGGIVGALTELGYDSKFGIVRASDAGGPHQRARWFCFSFLSAKQTDKRRFVADANSGPLQRQRKFGILESSKHNEQELVGNSFAGSSQDTANAQSAERGDTQHERVGTPTGSAAESGECVSETAWGEYEPAIRRWERIVGRVAPPPVEDDKLSPRFVEWMMGLEKGWVCDHITQRTKALSCLGNGVVPQQAILALHLLTADDA